MGDQLLPSSLTERSVHLCVDMQRIFSAEGPWPANLVAMAPFNYDFSILGSMGPADSAFIQGLICAKMALGDRRFRMTHRQQS